MDTKVYKLDDKTIREHYTKTINQGDTLVFTFTLNPKSEHYLYQADILTQYRKAVWEFKTSKLFMFKQGKQLVVHPAFTEMILVPELTAEMNIHFHGYFRCDPQYNKYFQNEVKKLTYNNKVLGRQHSFKLIDSLTDTLKGYPFKDIKELLKFPDSSKIYIYQFTRII